MPSEQFLNKDGSLSTLSYPYDTTAQIDFAGKTFCLIRLENADLMRQVEEQGGRWTATISGKTDYLVIPRTAAYNTEEELHVALERREKTGKPLFLLEKDLAEFLKHSWHPPAISLIIKRTAGMPYQADLRCALCWLKIPQLPVHTHIGLGIAPCPMGVRLGDPELL